MPTITIDDFDDQDGAPTEVTNLEEACAHLAGVCGVYAVSMSRDCSRDVLLYLLARPGSQVSVYTGTGAAGRTWRQADVSAKVCGVLVNALRVEGQDGFDLLIAAHLTDAVANAPAIEVAA